MPPQPDRSLEPHEPLFQPREPPRTRLLVSVRNATEARAALAGGADLIDIKEPSRGSLGRPECGQIADVVGAVEGRVPVSVALGELNDWDAVRRTRVDGPESDPSLRRCQYVKLGLAGCGEQVDWPQRWSTATVALRPVKPVSVVYADWQHCRAPRPAVVLRYAAEFGSAALLIDTFDKSSGGLFAVWPRHSLAEFFSEARSARIPIVLAGSLSAATFAQAAALHPDYLAVRGAVCHGSREGVVDSSRVRELREILDHGTLAR
jgi:uncharacterized protein (UPF0264 family)